MNAALPDKNYALDYALDLASELRSGDAPNIRIRSWSRGGAAGTEVGNCPSVLSAIGLAAFPALSTLRSPLGLMEFGLQSDAETAVTVVAFHSAVTVLADAACTVF